MRLYFLSFILPFVEAWRPKFLARQQQEVCLRTYTVESALSPTVSGQAFAVLSLVPNNTVIFPGTFGVPVTVTNAPTLLNTTITAYSTVTRTIIRTYVTMTMEYEGPTITTISVSSPNAPSDAVRTIYVFVPQSYVVVTQLYTGTTTSTTTVTSATAGQTGTIVLYVPRQYSTLTSLYSGSVASTTTQVTPVTPGQFGTIVVYLPGTYTTITQVYGGSTTSLSTISTPISAGQTLTILVQVPATYITTTSFYTGLITNTITQVVPSTVGQTGTIVVQIPSAAGAVSAPSAVPTNVCGIQGSSPDGSCLVTLPLACQAFSNPTLLGAVLNLVDLLACQAALGLFGTISAATCFVSSIPYSLTGANVLSCLQTHVPMCSACISTLPTVCLGLNASVAFVDIAVLTSCESALGVLGNQLATVCFAVSSVVQTLTGQNVFNCLLQNVPICPTTSPAIPDSLIGSTAVTACSGTTTTIPCLTALPSDCLVQSSAGLLGSVLGAVNTIACQLALGVYGTVNAAVCFTSSLLGSLTGQDFTSCLTNHLPMCNKCVTALPPACQITSGQLCSFCQAVLGLYGTTIAASCFVPSILSVVVNANLVDCLARTLPFCSGTILSTTTQVGGAVAYTSTVTSTISGNALSSIAARTTTYVVVNQLTPAPFLPTVFTTTIGGAAFTRTATTTVPGNVLNLFASITSTYVLVGVPITPIFVTQTSVYPGAVTTTITPLVPSIAGQFGTIIVQIPAVYVTLTSSFIGAVLGTSTQLVPTLVGQVGVVIVQRPLL